MKYILEELSLGDVAYSDAGTPGINDPGYELVNSALSNGYNVSPIPGPSAPIAALVASGLPTDSFLYLGYLPRKSKERRDYLAQTADFPFTLIFFEVPHRLLDSLSDMAEILGNRRIAIARELTKIHEEIYRGDIRSSLIHFKAGEPHGEFTLVLEGKPRQQPRWTEEALIAWIEEQITSGKSASQIADSVSRFSGWQRREIYLLINLTAI